MTACYSWMGGQNDSHQPTNGLFFPIPSCWSRRRKRYLYSLGREIYKALLEKASKGLPGEISANLPHCRLAQWFKQLRVISPQQTVVNVHCQYVQINISGEIDKDITVHVSSQIHCVLFPSFFFLSLKYISMIPIKPWKKRNQDVNRQSNYSDFFFPQLFCPSQILLHGSIAQWEHDSEEMVSTSALTMWP